MPVFTNSQQVTLVLQSLLLGVGIGAVYDMLRALRLHFRCGWAGAALLDTLFWAIVLAALFEFGLIAAAGQPRGFVLLTAARAPTPEEHVEGRETQRLVREGLAALPEDYRRVLVLRELHQLSYAEICEVTELELGTVKSRINRARLLLRNYLAADGNFFEKPASKVTECNFQR